MKVYNRLHNLSKAAVTSHNNTTTFELHNTGTNRSQVLHLAKCYTGDVERQLTVVFNPVLPLNGLI